MSEPMQPGPTVVFGPEARPEGYDRFGFDPPPYDLEDSMAFPPAKCNLSPERIQELKSYPRPKDEERMIAIEFDDIFAGSTEGLLGAIRRERGGQTKRMDSSQGVEGGGEDRDAGKADKADKEEEERQEEEEEEEEVRTKDIESIYLYHSKGFGSPHEVVDTLSKVKYYRTESLSGLSDTLCTLRYLGYVIHIITSRPDDPEDEKKTYDIMSNWLKLRGISLGPHSLVRNIYITLSDWKWIDPDVRALQETVDFRVPPGMEVEEEDRAAVVSMRQRALLREVYLTETANGLPTIPVSIVISPHASDILALRTESNSQNQPTGQRIRKGEMRYVLFGTYGWNTRSVDWTFPGAWVSYEERKKRGWEIGPEYDLRGVEGVRDWREMGELFVEEAKGRERAVTFSERQRRRSGEVMVVLSQSPTVHYSDEQTSG